MEAAEAAGANVTPEVKAAADTAAETADALVNADAITENVPAAVEVNGAVDPQPAVAGSAGAAAPAAASDGAGEVCLQHGSTSTCHGEILTHVFAVQLLSQSLSIFTCLDP